VKKREAHAKLHRTLNIKYLRDMDKNLMDALYVSYNEKIGVLSDNEHNVVSHILGTDLTLVFDKQEMKTYLLVPLSKRHKIECHPGLRGKEWVKVDGKKIASDDFFRKDACQWIEVKTYDILSEVA
jgi:hypothetical protein